MVKTHVATLAAVGVMALAGAASAASWTETDDKGLKLYELNEGMNRIAMTCDPEKLWQPPIFHLRIFIGNVEAEGGTITFAKGDETMTVKSDGGFVLASDIETWPELLAMISTAGEVAVSSGTQTATFVIENERIGACQP